MKKVADQMTAGSFFISEKEIVMCILTGLGPKYEILFVNHISRPHLPTLKEVKSNLV